MATLKLSTPRSYQSTWYLSENILSEHEPVSVTQVYCWIFTQDNKIVIVSKDGKNWQLPGGHPHPNEKIPETAIREIQEETGLDISSYKLQIKLFGYYNVLEYAESRELPNNFLQLRTVLNLPEDSSELNLKPNENSTEKPEDTVFYCKFVSTDELLKLIPWMEKKEEYQTFKSHK